MELNPLEMIKMTNFMFYIYILYIYITIFRKANNNNNNKQTKIREVGELVNKQLVEMGFKPRSF